MLTSLTVTTSQGNQLVLPLDDTSSGLIITSIEGLDPVEATLVSSSFANADGAQYHSSRREPRNIKLSLDLDPDFTVDSVRDLRKRLYAFFMPKSQVTLRFHLVEGDGVLDYLDLDILGRVETFEAPLFTDEPTADISLMCFDPDFLDEVPGSFKGVTTADLTQLTLTYPGTVETGMLLTLRPDRAMTNFTVYHSPPDGTLRTFDFAYPLLAGDVVKINTVVGQKSITLTRAGVDSSILYARTPQSNWLELLPGDNKLRVYATGASVPFSIDYVTRYGGL